MDRSRFNRFVNQPLREFPLAAPLFVSPGQSVRTAVAGMQRANGSCVLIGTAAAITGIFTERDVLTKCMGDGFDWDQPLDQSPVVTREPRTIASERTVAEAIASFQLHGYRTLPVVNGSEVLGLVRVEDVLHHLAEAFPEELLNLPPRPHQVMEKQEGG